MNLEKHKLPKNECNLTHIEIYERQPLSIRQIIDSEKLEELPKESLELYIQSSILGVIFYKGDRKLTLLEMEEINRLYIEDCVKKYKFNKK